MTIESDNIEVLKYAIKKNTKIDIKYVNNNGYKSNRSITPLRFTKSKSNNHLVIALDSMTNEQKNKGYNKQYFFHKKILQS